MKPITLFLFLLIAIFSFGQSLPINFEADVSTADFVDFDGGVGTVIANPYISGINTSDSVGQIVRDGGAIWAGSKIILDQNLDFTTMNSITMKVYTTAPAGTTVKFKLEGNGVATERDVFTSVSNQWELLTWDFTGEPTSFNEVVFMFDFGNTGNGSANSTFFFDDVQQLFGGDQIDFPVDFEDASVNYMTTDFDGTASVLLPDPTNPTNTVIQVVKTASAGATAGTTIGTNAGFASNLPFTLDDTKMSIRVWSPDAGIPIRLKVEDSNDPTRTCETETNTSVAGEWETLIFDFNNEAPGTAELSFGLQNGWSYNMATIFFNFGTPGAAAGQKTYYFDDVYFGDVSSTNKYTLDSAITVFPNPSNDLWTLSLEKGLIIKVEVFDANGKMVKTVSEETKLIQVAMEQSGIYFAKITSDEGVGVVKLMKI